MRPHGRNPAPPAPHPELLQTVLGLPAVAANERLDFMEPLPPSPLPLLPSIARGQHSLHERTRAPNPGGGLERLQVEVADQFQLVQRVLHHDGVVPFGKRYPTRLWQRLKLTA